jgi:hypothetical protein
MGGMKESITGQMVEEAKGVVGTTANQRARWLLEFLRQDPGKITGHERVTVQLALAIFVAGSVWPIKPGVPIPCNSFLPRGNELEQWRDETVGLLEAFKEKRRWEMEVTVKRSFSRAGDGVKIEPVPTMEKSMAFQEAVLDTLQAAQAHLRFCANTSCDALFVRSGKQKYCSPRCEGTASKRTHRQRVKARPVTVSNQQAPRSATGC